MWKSIWHTLSNLFVATIIGALVGAAAGSYLSYWSSITARANSDKTIVRNFLVLIKEDLKRQQKLLESADFIDRVLLSNFINWDSLKRDRQEKYIREVGGKRVVKGIALTTLNLAIQSEPFFAIDTQIFLMLDGIAHDMNFLNGISERIIATLNNHFNRVPTGDVSLYSSFLKKELDLFDRHLEELKRSVPACIAKVDNEIKRFSN
jgi:hypothetical protein